MFTWSNDISIDVDVPLQKAWDFFMDPRNWPKWEDQLEACAHEGALRTGSKVKAKIKNRSIQVVILITEVKPYECKCSLQVPFFTQENANIFQEISPRKTRITLRTCVISFFAPFMKRFFLKKLEKERLRFRQAFDEIAIQQQI